MHSLGKAPGGGVMRSPATKQWPGHANSMTAKQAAAAIGGQEVGKGIHSQPTRGPPKVPRSGSAGRAYWVCFFLANL
jgi:hypothetical protein